MKRLTRMEAAAYLGIGRTTLDGLVKAGKLEYYKGESRTSKIFFEEAELDRYIESTKVYRAVEKARLGAFETYRKRRVKTA